MSWFDQGWGLSLTVFLPLVGVGMLLLLVLLHLLFEEVHPLCEALHRIFDLVDLLGGCSSRSCELSLDFLAKVSNVLGDRN